MQLCLARDEALCRESPANCLVWIMHAGPGKSDQRNTDGKHVPQPPGIERERRRALALAFAVAKTMGKHLWRDRWHWSSCDRGVGDYKSGIYVPSPERKVVSWYLKSLGLETLPQRTLGAFENHLFRCFLKLDCWRW